ncbi:MAG TPA: extracellular solute-binding protein [Arachnia sp.]|nr:extracellular solute-binding protein [Arachnia sp.]HMT86233.1 extracellular solute-binding protein [Arachnia sp.]
MRNRSFVSIGVTLGAALLLASCTGGGGGTAQPTNAPTEGDDGALSGEITFQTWSLKNDTFTPYFEGVVKAFEDANPGTTIKWVDQPADGYEDKILQQAESGELPDVINLPPEYAFTLAKVGQLADLASVSSKLGDYVPGGIEAYTYDGIEGSFGFPWYLGTELNYWNTDLLQQGGVTEVPSTIDETLDAAEKLAAANIQTLADIPSPKSLKIFISDQGGQLDIFKDGTFGFNTPEAVKLVERWAELYQLGAVSPDALQGAGTANSNINSFNKGTVAWTTAGPNYIDRDLAVNAPTLLPKIEVMSGFGTPPLFVQGITVSGVSKNPALALAFAEYVTNTDNQIEFVKLAPGFFPGTIAANAQPDAFVVASDYEKQNRANELAADQMDRAALINPPQFTEAMEGYAKQQIALAVRGDITAQEALDAAVAYAEQNLAE